jgi:hypothetical protein
MPVDLPKGSYDVEPFPILHKALRSLSTMSNDEAFATGLKYIVAGGSQMM